MRTLKTLLLAGLAILPAAALLGPGTASATNLYKYTTPSANDRIAIGTEIALSLRAGTSVTMKDTSGLTNDTCTGSELKAKLENDTGSVPSVNAQGPISLLTLTGCSHTTTTVAPGSLEFKNIAGTTNATVISRGTRITLKSTVFGISCFANTGAGTTMGSLTGATSSTGSAAFDLNGLLTLENGCGDSPWTGEYLVTGPIGMTAEA